MMDKYHLPHPGEGRPDILREGVKDNCESVIGVYFLFCHLCAVHFETMLPVT